MSKVYCGIGEIPKNKKRGSMKECAETNQIRYWGEKKVDKKLISHVQDKKNNKLEALEKQSDKLKIKLVGLRGKSKRISRDLEGETDKKKIQALQKEKNKADAELTETANKYQQLVKKLEFVKKEKKLSRVKVSKKISKKISKKTSKKISKKK